MTFLETPRLDPLITHGAKSTAQWSVEKTRTLSGNLAQQFNWDAPLHILELSYRARPEAQYQVLRDYFHAVMANALVGFRAKDWSDYKLSATTSTLSFISGADWQIQRLHAVGVSQYLRNITKPISPVVLMRTRGASVSAAGATIDYTTGIATIDGHVGGDTYTASGEFDIPVTFVTDSWISNLEATSDNLWISPDPIRLEEIRL